MTTRTRSTRVRSEDAAQYNATQPPPSTDDDTIAAALDILYRRLRALDGPVFESPKALRDYARLNWAALQHEVFVVVYLDNRHRLIVAEELFRGTIDGCSVYPREVVKSALNHNAAAVILIHNHPSGCADPSHADQLITARLKDALAMVDIRVLDHLIVAGRETCSFAERGLI